MINFASLFLQSTINFILPLLIYIRAIYWSRTQNTKEESEHSPVKDPLWNANDFLGVKDPILTREPSIQNEDMLYKGQIESTDEPKFRALPQWLMSYSVALSYCLIVLIVALVAGVIGINIYVIVDDAI